MSKLFSVLYIYVSFTPILLMKRVHRYRFSRPAKTVQLLLNPSFVVVVVQPTNCLQSRLSNSTLFRSSKQ